MVLYLARVQPVRLLDEMMVELQTVETLNCLIERTETPPFYRLTVMRKASSHSDGTNGVPGQTDSSSRNDLSMFNVDYYTRYLEICTQNLLFTHYVRLMTVK